MRLLSEVGGIRGDVARERRFVRNDRGPLLGLAYRSHTASERASRKGEREETHNEFRRRRIRSNLRLLV